MSGDKILFKKEIDVKYNVDVAVFGGGLAGVGAAFAAGKLGYNVILVERLGWLGGNGTSGGVRGFCGETSHQGEIFSDITSELERFGAIEPYFLARDVFFKGRKYEHQYLVPVLDALAKKYNVQLLLHTRFIDAIRENNELKTALIAEKQGIFGVNAKFFIDCTGEGDVCLAAGCEMKRGRESDGLQLPMSVIGFYRRKGLFNKQKNIPEEYFSHEKIKNIKEKPMTSFSSCGRYSRGIKIKVPKFDSTDSVSLTDAEIEARKEILRVLDFYKNRRKRRWELEHLSPIIGIREGARVLGEYYLTVDDCRHGKTFEDAVAVGHYPLDAHDPTDNKRTYILDKKDLRVPPYDIPFRSLIPKGMKNLLVAGRNLSADQLALSSARVMTTCCAMGQAAALGADLCIKNNIEPLRLAVEKTKILRNAVTEFGISLDHDLYRASSH